MEYDVWIWVAFGAFVVAMLCIDLFAFGGSKDGISMSRAVGWTIGFDHARTRVRAGDVGPAGARGGR